MKFIRTAKKKRLCAKLNGRFDTRVIVAKASSKSAFNALHFYRERYVSLQLSRFELNKFS